MRLILASASPRRRDLLRRCGVEPAVRVADVDEGLARDEPAAEAALRLARAKARAIGELREDVLILAADTLVSVDDEVLGKPLDSADNRRMLARLAGRTHQVYTGVWIRRPSMASEAGDVARTDVEFSTMEADAIDWYIASGEGLDKAGGYGIQGRAGLFVRAVAGSDSNVVGLPLELVARLVTQLGVRWPQLAR